MNTPSLQPWEIPPDFEVIPQSVSHFKRTCNGVALDWTLGLIKVPACRRPILWARPQGNQFDAGFVSYETTHHQTKHFDEDTKPFALRMSFAHLWDRNLFARLFCLNKQGNLRSPGEAAREAIVVAPDGIAAWSLATISPQVHDSTAFRWSKLRSNAQFLSLPAQEVWAQIQSLLADERGDARLARQFALCNEEQRYQLLWSGGRITEDEFKALLRDLVLSQEFWDKAPYNAQLTVRTLSPDDATLSFGAVHPAHGAHLPLLFVEKLWNSFLPPNRYAFRRSCVRGWAQMNVPNFEILIESPTAHERLEARLRWQEWLAQTQEAR